MRLLCIGDVGLVDQGKPRDAWHPPAKVIPSKDEKIMFNWELPLADMLNPAPRDGMRFIAPVDSVRAIQSWSPGIATLATNHILDGGITGLSTTIDVLKQAGFAIVGAGMAPEAITQPLVWESSEGCLAIVNWVFPETHPDWMMRPGPNCWPGSKQAARLVHQLRREVDWVLVAVHWSDEFYSFPRPQDRVVARELALSGADFIVGSHPHVVRGAEIVGKCPIFYSLGNFYFSDLLDRDGGWLWRETPRNREGLGLQIDFRRGQPPDYRTLSFWNSKDRVISDPRFRATKRMNLCSGILRKHENAEYLRWYSNRRARFDRWGYRWYFGIRNANRNTIKRRLLRLRGLFFEYAVRNSAGQP